jgi:hypothetical protein
MYRAFSCFVWLVISAAVPALAEPKATDPSSPRPTMADCAAAYQANWQNRLSGFDRSRDMSNMIQMQSEDYKAAAVRYSQKEEKVSLEDAKRRVDAHIASNVARFIAMDKAGTLEALIENCPEIELEGPN